MPGAQSREGCLRIQWWHRLQGWVSGGLGLSWSAGPSLPAAGPAGALLHRVRAEQGSEGAIGRGATTLHLEVGSQGRVLAGAPVGGGQGIWKESRRVALGALRGTFAPAAWPARGVLCPARTGLHSVSLEPALKWELVFSKWRDRLGQGTEVGGAWDDRMVALCHGAPSYVGQGRRT